MASQPRKKQVKKQVKKEPKKLTKAQATKKGVPYFEIINYEYDPKNPSIGAFELDWNQEFINELRKLGYQGNDDQTVIDNYFTNVCRHVVFETYEKEQAMNPDTKQASRKDIGNGRAEYS